MTRLGVGVGVGVRGRRRAHDQVEVRARVRVGSGRRRRAHDQVKSRNSRTQSVPSPNPIPSPIPNPNPNANPNRNPGYPRPYACSNRVFDNCCSGVLFATPQARPATPPLTLTRAPSLASTRTAQARQATLSGNDLDRNAAGGVQGLRQVLG